MDASQIATPIVESLVNSETDQTQIQLEVSAPPAEPKAKKPRPTPKAPPNADRPPGKSLLPLARVQRIMKADKELPSCNKEAVFLISVATEEFIKRLGQAGQLQAVREKRSTVQRKDVVTAVRRSDEFVFLEEILSIGMSAPPPAPVKHKTKGSVATAKDAESMNIKEAFGKGKAKTSSPSDDEEGHGDEAELPESTQNNVQEDDDSMNVS